MYTTLVERILREATIEIEKFPKRNIPLEFLSVVSRELIRHSREKTFLGLLEIFSTIRCTLFEEDSKID